MTRKHRAVKPLEALLKIPARRASSRVRSDGVIRGFASLDVCRRAQCLGFRTPTGSVPVP
jgi:hypothetical protein